MSTFGLAPQVVVRIAGWPLRAVADFNTASLAALARTDDSGYAAAYAAAVDDHRARLWTRTVDDSRFMAALAVVNPALAESLHDKPLPPTRNKSARHYETTLYRYLARAASRTEPCGLWTSVTLARFGEDRRTRRAERRVRVAPDLTPFRTLLLALRDRSPYAERARYKLNPTLRRDADGAWIFWSAPGRGPATQRRLAGSPALDAALATLAVGDWTTAEACDRIERDTPLSAAQAAKVLRQLQAGSVIVGGLAFPKAFRDPWDALRRAQALLDDPAATAWRSAVAELRTLADAFDPDRADAVIAAHAAAGRVIARLAAVLQVDDVQLPRAPLRVDTRAPWRIQLSAGDVEDLRRCVETFSRHQSADCLHGHLLRATTRDMLPSATTTLSAAVPQRIVDGAQGLVTWEAIAAELQDDELTDCVATLDTHLRPQDGDAAATAVEHDRWLQDGPAAAGPSLAALHFTFGDATVAGRPVIHGLGLDATAAYARLAPVLDGAPLEDWFRRSYRVLAEREGVDFVALLYDHPTPNVLGRPDLWTDAIDPWGVTPHALPTRGTELRSGTSAPVLRVPGRHRPAVAVAPTAASVRVDDPCMNALLLSSMHLPPVGRGYPVHACELEAPTFCPRLRLPDGSIVHNRRTILRGNTLAALLQHKGAPRFARWQRLASDHGWPALVWVARPGRPPLLVGRDSPLAVEAAFEGARRSPYVLIEEFTAAAWIGDDHEHDRHVAQLVLPFVRAPRARPTRAAVDPAQRRTGPLVGIAGAG